MNIWIAASDNKISLVENYLSSGNFSAVSADPNGYTPIHAAASYGHKELLEKLVTQYNGDINIKDSDGDTPLHHVEDYETCKFVIESLKGDYQIRNNDGLMPIEVLLQNGDDNDKESLKMLTYLQNLSYGNNQSFDNIYSVDGLDNESLDQLKQNLKIKLTDNASIDTCDEMDKEKYNRVQHIMNNSENVDADLEKYVLEMIKEQMVQQANQNHQDLDDFNSKKQKR